MRLLVITALLWAVSAEQTELAQEIDTCNEPMDCSLGEFAKCEDGVCYHKDALPALP